MSHNSLLISITTTVKFTAIKRESDFLGTKSKQTGKKNGCLNYISELFDCSGGNSRHKKTQTITVSSEK